MSKEKSDIISDVVTMLKENQENSAKQIIINEYPHKIYEIKKRTYTTTQKMEQFIRDGFIDRYTGEKLLNPGILKVLSTYFPDEFPFHPHWKMTETHVAYWELIPTIDHIFPIAKGGDDDRSNWVTTSMKNNSIKSNYTIDEIHWTIYPQGNIKDWDGLSEAFIHLVDQKNELLKDNYIKLWYHTTKKLLNQLPLATRFNRQI